MPRMRFSACLIWIILRTILSTEFISVDRTGEIKCTLAKLSGPLFVTISSDFFTRWRHSHSGYITMLRTHRQTFETMAVFMTMTSSACRVRTCCNYAFPSAWGSTGIRRPKVPSLLTRCSCFEEHYKASYDSASDTNSIAWNRKSTQVCHHITFHLLQLHNIHYQIQFHLFIGVHYLTIWSYSTIYSAVCFWQ